MERNSSHSNPRDRKMKFGLLTSLLVTVSQTNPIVAFSHHAALSTRGGATTTVTTKPAVFPKQTVAVQPLKMTAVASLEGGAQESGGTATISNEIFNLVKNIVGAGVLSLPAGIAAFANAPSALAPALFLIAFIGTISAYCFSLIGRVCSWTGAQSYRQAWDKTVGEKTSLLPAFACTAKTSVAVLAYSMILGDTFSNLFASVGMEVSRTASMLGITGTVLLPLCWLKNLSSLAPFSLLGIMGMAYTSLAMGISYMGGNYKLPAGKFLADLKPAMQPQFGSVGAKGLLDPNSFILICMLSTAYMAHFNAPKFFVELKDNTVKRYNTVVASSFGIAITIFGLIASLGFLTFGSASSGLILNNYSNKDILMSFSRVAVAVSIVFSYPLAFVGVREGVMDLLKISPEKRTNGLLNKLTVIILSVITALALKVKDLSFVLSFGGATLGNALIFVFPALMFRSGVKNMGEKATKGLKTEAKFAAGTAALGVIMGAIGAKMAIQAL